VFFYFWTWIPKIEKKDFGTKTLIYCKEVSYNMIVGLQAYGKAGNNKIQTAS
jgi:hypothetical protein